MIKFTIQINLKFNERFTQEVRGKDPRNRI